MIKNLRIKLKEDQATFGKRYGKSQSVVSRWENPDENLLPDPDVAKIIVADAKKLRIKGASLEAIYG